MVKKSPDPGEEDVAMEDAPPPDAADLESR